MVRKRVVTVELLKLFGSRDQSVRVVATFKGDKFPKETDEETIQRSAEHKALDWIVSHRGEYAKRLRHLIGRSGLKHTERRWFYEFATELEKFECPNGHPW